MSYLGIDRKGLFQGVGRSAADSISNVANQKAIAEILMMGTEEFMAGRISRQELHQALAGVGNLTGSYKGSMFGKQRRHEAAGNLYQILRTMVDDAEQWGVPCLALIPGRVENLEFDNGRNHPEPFASWFGHMREWLNQDVCGGNDDWKEYDSRSGEFARHLEPNDTGTNDTGTFVHPFLGHHRINPRDSGYPNQVWKDDLDLRIGHQTFKKIRYQPVPQAAIDALYQLTRNDKALGYAALLLAHQGLMRGAMHAVCQHLTVLTSGVAVGPGLPSGLYTPEEASYHITGSPSSLTVTYNQKMSEEGGG